MTGSFAVFLHIALGAAALISGAAALGYRKGSTRHRAAGTAFALSMLATAGSATYLAAFVSPVVAFALLILILILFFIRVRLTSWYREA